MEAIYAFFGSDAIISFFIKAFAITFCILFLLYSMVFLKQAQVMMRTLVTRRGRVITAMAWYQILVGLFLLFLAFVMM